MTLEIRQATETDIPAIMTIKMATWPDETANSEQMAKAFANHYEHAAAIAFIDGRPAGFADGFVTTSAENVLRWELDLLAVHPDFRGMGLAPQLIQANLDCAAWLNPQQTRALIHIDNIASERSFARCGYIPELFTSGLYIASEEKISGHPIGDHHGHLIPVDTLSYSGYWVEGAYSASAFDAGQIERVKRGLPVAGAVIPLHEEGAIRAAEKAGYDLAGHYRYWLRDF